MAALWKRLFQAVSLLVLLALHTSPSFASEEIVFGPRDFKISWLRLHLSFHTFPVDEHGEGTLILSKKTPERRIEGGFVLLNNQLLGLHEFLQGENLSTEREVSLRSTNYLIVFLRGAPGATLSIMVKKAAAVPPPEVTFQAQPQTITLGETSTLEWTTAHADRVTIEPGIGEVPYVYDEAGNLRFKRDAKNVTVEYAYDHLNRTTAALYPDPAEDISYSYDQGTDGKGRLTNLTDASGTMSFAYDPRGRLVEKTSIIESISYPVTYVFTPGGKVHSITYPGGRTLAYARNPAGKISEVRGSGIAAPLAAGLAYRPFGGPLGMATASGGVVNNVAGECDCITVSNPGQPRERVYGYDQTAILPQSPAQTLPGTARHSSTTS